MRGRFSDVAHLGSTGKGGQKCATNLSNPNEIFPIYRQVLRRSSQKGSPSQATEQMGALSEVNKIEPQFLTKLYTKRELPRQGDEKK